MKSENTPVFCDRHVKLKVWWCGGFHLTPTGRGNSYVGVLALLNRYQATSFRLMQAMVPSEQQLKVSWTQSSSVLIWTPGTIL